MPGIFNRCDGRWQLATVARSPSALRLDPVRVEPAVAPPDGDTCVLVRVEGGIWAALMADNSAVRHNGAPVAAGLRMLEHRDALALRGAAPVFFSTEEPARVEAFVADAPVSCPRCRSDVMPGAATVRCPSCGAVHHEMPDRNCWTYAENCSLCPQPTALDAGLRWSPEEL